MLIDRGWESVLPSRVSLTTAAFVPFENCVGNALPTCASGLSPTSMGHHANVVRAYVMDDR